MIRESDPFDHDPEPPAPLALLGLVAALLCFVAERVLPRWGREPEAVAMLAPLHLAMAGLAGAAWRNLDAPQDDLRELEAHAGALLAAMAALATWIERERCLRARLRPWRPAARLCVARTGPCVPVRAPAPARRATRARPRDGPAFAPA